MPIGNYQGQVSRPVDEDAVARLRAVIGRLDRRLSLASRGSELTPTQMSVLTAVVRHGSITVGDLATAENLNPTMLSRVVGKLDDAGLVTRAADVADRRVTIVEPTAAGRRLKKRIQQQRTDELAGRLTRLSPDQETAVLAVLPALELLATDSIRP